MIRSNARDEVLGRLKQALPDSASNKEAGHSAIRRDYIRQGSLAAGDRIELFLERLRDYDTQVIEVCDAVEIRYAVASVMQSSGDELLLLPEKWPSEWVPEGVATLIDRVLATDELQRATAVLTTCEVAVASTGTIFLVHGVHGGSQGRRVATLLPDHHICIVRRDQILETIPEGIMAVRQFSTQPITTISGPSATSDIEMTRIRGVHGPRHLTVLLLSEAGY